MEFKISNSIICPMDGLPLFETYGSVSAWCTHVQRIRHVVRFRQFFCVLDRRKSSVGAGGMDALEGMMMIRLE